MIKKFSNPFVSKVVGAITIVTFMVSIVSPNLAIAAGITSAKDTATRLKISTTADHTVTFTLPTGVDFDIVGNPDGIQVAYPSSFTLGGTWTTSDFTFTDSNGAHTVEAVAQGAGTITCTSTTAQNVCVAVDTTNKIFTIKPSTTYTSSSTGSAITFTIGGTSPNGTLTNPSSVAATNISINMCDETASCFTAFTTSYTSQLAYGIADDDQVTISANVPSTITFDLDAKSDFSSGASAAPYLVHLGTLSTGTVKHSDTSSVEMIVVNGATNGTGALVVTVQNANGASGLVSAGTPGDTIPSATATMAAGTANYGICIDSGGSLTSFTAQGIYTATPCTTASSTNHVATMTTSPVSILSATGPVSAAKAEIFVNATISTSTKAHTDYGDTITFIGTATY